ncbi:hypothetical protein RYX36_001830 [Vicia faba]
MCYYYPDAAKLGGAIMAGEGSTSAPSECFWWQIFLFRPIPCHSTLDPLAGARTESSLGPSEGIQNGATGGDAEATRVGSDMISSGLMQCAVTLQQAYSGITPYDIHTKLSVPVSLTRSGNLVGTDLEGSANGSNDAEAYIERINSLFYGHPLPPRDEWDDWLSNISANSSVTIQKCIMMEFDSTGDLFCYPGGYGLEELESLKDIPDRFPFVSAKMDEKKDKNWFTRLDYSGIFFFELASKAGSYELVYCVFYMDKPLLLWAGRPSVSMNGLTMSLQCLVESIASLFTHRRLFSSHRSRDTRPSFNYELSSLES